MSKHTKLKLHIGCDAAWAQHVVVSLFVLPLHAMIVPSSKHILIPATLDALSELCFVGCAPDPGCLHACFDELDLGFLANL